MPLDHHPTPPQTPAAWHVHTLAAWRELAEARADNRALREVLHAALDLLHDQHLEIERLRRRYHALLDERRRAAAA